MKNKIALSVLLSLFCGAVLADSGDLKVSVAGVRGSEGSVRIAVYRDEKTFGKEKKAVTVREAIARGGDVGITIRSLPAGRYAIFAYHDRNANRKFDRTLGLVDAEGQGLSNNPERSAEHNFDSAAFDFAGGDVAQIHIELDYCHSGPDEEKSLARSVKCWATLAD